MLFLFLHKVLFLFVPPSGFVAVVGEIDDQISFVAIVPVADLE